jgi:hypothetical protein
VPKRRRRRPLSVRERAAILKAELIGYCPPGHVIEYVYETPDGILHLRAGQHTRKHLLRLAPAPVWQDPDGHIYWDHIIATLFDEAHQAGRYYGGSSNDNGQRNPLGYDVAAETAAAATDPGAGSVRGVLL